MKRFVVVAFCTLICLAGATPAQDTPKSNQTPCSSPESSQFDFWVGHWTVTANGNVAGTNKITKILGGCLLLEEYTGAKNYAGKSFNFYDEVSGKWNQVWVDNSGVTLKLHGEYYDGKMIMEGISKRGGETLVDRITWFNNSDGTVRQEWEVSKDGGKHFKTIFDGLYTRKR